MATPAPRNSSDLKAAWMTSWAPAMAGAPAPIAMNISPYWAEVDPASAGFASGWSAATAPPANTVTSPTSAMAGRNHGTTPRSGDGDDQQVGAGGHQRGRVQERGDGRRTGHRREQPLRERHLRRLGGRREQQPGSDQVGGGTVEGRDRVEPEAAGRREQDPRGGVQPEIPDAGGDEGDPCGRRRARIPPAMPDRATS